MTIVVSFHTCNPEYMPLCEVADDYRGFYCYGCGEFILMEQASAEIESHAVDLEHIIQMVSEFGD